MLLAIDIGNSNVVTSFYDGKEWTKVFRYETKKALLPGIFYESGLRDILLEWGVSRSQIEKIVISSVVPELNDRMNAAVFHNTGKEAFFLSPEVFLELDMHVTKPYEIGADLVANAYAAKNLYQKDTIVVDFGTALTFTIVSVKEGILGVTIAPGLKTAISALSGNTAQLPMVDLKLPDSVIGHSTVEAIQAGVLWGYVGLVKEILAKMRSELGPHYTAVATGGLSSILHPLDSEFSFVNKYLTLEGMRLITEKAGL